MTIKRLLLLSGAIGAGKTSVAKILKDECGFSGISSSGYLRAYGTQTRGLDGREDLQNLGDWLDQETNFRWIVDAVAVPIIEASPSAENWLLDAVRKSKQVEHFRAQFSTAVRHVHLYASENTLRSRYESRANRGDSDYFAAISHPNEVAARSLKTLADAAFDTTELDSSEIVRRVFRLWGE